MGAARIFISHSAKDAWVARQIAAQIRRRGAETFLDEADIAHGDDFEEAILSSTLAICRRKPLQNKGLTLRARFR